MLSVSNIKVYDLFECVVASGNAMRTEQAEYSEEEFKKGLERCKRLVRTSAESDVKCHDNFLTGIRVSFDVVYPQYWTPEFQRYHFADIVTSASKMHRLLKMNLEKSCNKYVTKETIEHVQSLIDEYNALAEEELWNEDRVMHFELRDGYVTAYDKESALYYAWMRVLSNTPLGLELFERVSTNYKQLQTIYSQRKNHKLKEDWGAFCSFVKSLPYAEEFIVGKEALC